MGKVEYSPKALNDLQRIKAYMIEHFGVDVANKALGKMTASVRRLETLHEVFHHVKKRRLLYFDSRRSGNDKALRNKIV